MADISPTMAEANPKRAGQSPEDQSRQHIQISDEKIRWAGYQLADQQGMLEGAVGSQADVSPTMAEAIPLGAGQSPKKDRRGQRRQERDTSSVAQMAAATWLASRSPTMAKAIPKRAGQSPPMHERWQGTRAEHGDKSTDLSSEDAQADVSPTMAQAIPERAGQSPAALVTAQAKRQTHENNDSEGTGANSPAHEVAKMNGAGAEAAASSLVVHDVHNTRKKDGRDSQAEAPPARSQDEIRPTMAEGSASSSARAQGSRFLSA